MEELKQFDFFFQRGYCFANRPCTRADIPSNCQFYSDAVKLATYNNENKGIIENDFFEWALKNSISYDAIEWFLKGFSEQDDVELLSIARALFKRYTIYLDESSNAVKFRFKNHNGETNVPWYNDFVLAGIALDEKSQFSIDDLFKKFNLQQNVSDAKLKNIAKYNGEDANRLLSIIKSPKVKMLLTSLNSADGVYIHWDTLNLLYYSLVDLVDSCIEIPFLDEEVKNALFLRATTDEVFLELLSKYNYPNIHGESTEEFCLDIIMWIEGLHPKNEIEEFMLECLRQGLKSSRRSNSLILLSNNVDGLLIDNFVPEYAMRLAVFPNSTLIYDECSIVQENLEKYVDMFCTVKAPNYYFEPSENNKWIQLADMISGIIAALMSYVNTHNENQIKDDYNKLAPNERECLKELMKLRLNSSEHNIFFDHMSRNHVQYERLSFLMRITKQEV